MPRSSYKQKSAPRPDAKQRSHKGAGELRIIGGLLRGRKLAIADVPGLRPTTDRVRETLFNWLRPELAGADCLDLFAGSGALGFEAASNGAHSVTFVESSRAAATALSANIQQLNAGNCHVVNNRADYLSL